MTVETDWKEVARRKAPEDAPEWLIDLLAKDEVFQRHQDVNVFEIQPGDEIELINRSGSGSLFSLHTYWEVKRGKVTVVDREEKPPFSAGSAWSRTTTTTVRLSPGTVVFQVFDEYRSPEHTYCLRIYYRP